MDRLEGITIKPRHAKTKIYAHYVTGPILRVIISKNPQTNNYASSALRTTTFHHDIAYNTSFALLMD